MAKRKMGERIWSGTKPEWNKTGVGILIPLRMKETLRGLKSPLQLSYLPD